MFYEEENEPSMILATLLVYAHYSISVIKSVNNHNSDGTNSKTRNFHLIGLSVVITASKYVHVPIQGAAAGPRHRGWDFPCHVKHLP